MLRNSDDNGDYTALPFSPYHSRTCTCCKATKPLRDFYDTATKKRGQCKQCMNRAAYDRVLASPEQYKARLLYGTRSRARRQGRECSITVDDFSIPAVCPVLGIPLKAGGNMGRKAPNSPSLDRIDNSKGYVKGNVVVVSLRANMLKSDATLDELAKLLAFYAGLELAKMETDK